MVIWSGAAFGPLLYIWFLLAERWRLDIPIAMMLMGLCSLAMAIVLGIIAAAMRNGGVLDKKWMHHINILPKAIGHDLSVEPTIFFLPLWIWTAIFPIIGGISWVFF